tara:strand:+ start:225 stop:677 length:453 start_codon:yes stop_codon:yes gene_type:complete
MRNKYILVLLFYSLNSCSDQSDNGTRAFNQLSSENCKTSILELMGFNKVPQIDVDLFTKVNSDTTISIQLSSVLDKKKTYPLTQSWTIKLQSLDSGSVSEILDGYSLLILGDYSLNSPFVILNQKTNTYYLGVIFEFQKELRVTYRYPKE